MSTAQMEPDESMCFWRSWRVFKDGEITEEKKLQHDLAHIFDEAHHPDDTRHSEKTISESWAERDIVSAAVMLCMVHELPPPPVEKTLLISLILQSKVASLEDLQRNDRGPESILGIPLLYQLILAAAFKKGNRSLVREMISAAPPVTGHDILFSPPRYAMSPASPGDQGAFGGKKGYGHAALQGQEDNGCNLLVDMIKTGWAVPRAYMHSWAASAEPPEPGFRLMETLLEHEIEIDYTALFYAQISRNAETFRWILERYVPEDPSDRHDLLLRAAFDKEGGVEQMELLFKHGVNDINWRLPPEEPVSMPMYREDIVPYRTPLHNAAQCGNVAVAEWLINHGAEPMRDYLRMDPYDLAKSEAQEEIIKLFERYPDCRAYIREKSSCTVL